MNSPFNPFATGAGRSRSPYDDDAVMTPGARAVSDEIGRAYANEARRDPLAEQMTALTQRKTQIGHAKRAAEQMRDTFLANEGADLFEMDPVTGKIMKDPDGKYQPKGIAVLADLQKKAGEHVGFVEGAVRRGVSRGDPTEEAKAASRDLGQLLLRHRAIGGGDDARAAMEELAAADPTSAAVIQKWARIQDQVTKIKTAEDETEMQLGHFAAARLTRDGVDLGSALQFPQGQDNRLRYGGELAVAGKKPAPATLSTPPAANPAAVSPVTPQGGPTPLALVKMHRQMKEAESVMARDTTNPQLREALRQQNERMTDMFLKGMAALGSDGLRQRVIEITRDPTTGELVKNFMGRVGEGAGSSLVDMGEFLVRNTAGRAMGEQGNAKVAEFAQAMRDEAAGWGLDGVPKEVAEKLAETFSGQIGQGIGSTAAFIAPTVGLLRIGRLMGASPKVLKAIGVAVPGIVGGAATGNALRREAQANLALMAEAGELTPEEAARGADQAEFIGVLAGLTEAASPLGRWSKKIAGVPTGQTFLKEMGEKFKGGGMEAVTKWLRGNGRRRILDVASEAGEESFQELAQGYIENRAARGDLGNVAFDPKRDLGEGLAESAGTGGIVGALVSTLLGGYSGGNARRQKRIAEAMRRGQEQAMAREAAQGQPGDAKDRSAVDEFNAKLDQIPGGPKDFVADDAVEVDPELMRELQAQVGGETSTAASERAPVAPAPVRGPAAGLAPTEPVLAGQIPPVNSPEARPEQDFKIPAPPAPAAVAGSAGSGIDNLRRQLDRFDGGEAVTVSDLADAIEEMGEDAPAPLREAAEKFRAEVEDDFDNYGGRGDSGDYSDALEQAVRSHVAGQPTATPATLEGEKINREWTAFAPESQSLGIPRAEMPQVKAEHRGALTQFLKAKGIPSAEEEFLPGTLKPTQAEYSQAKVDKAREFTGGDRAILISNDGHVVDGHHQWMAKLTDEPNTPMRVIRLGANIQRVLETVKEFPSAQAAAGATPQTAKPKRASVTKKPAPAIPRQSFTDTRSDLLTKIDAAIAAVPPDASKADKITIQSGSSKFTVRNDKTVLQRLRQQVARKIPANEVIGREDGRPRDQGAVVKDYKAAQTEAQKRSAMDQMTPATLQKLGLAEKYERIAPGVTLTKEAAQALRDLKAGKRSKFTVTASAGSADSEIDPAAPASLAFVDATEGDYPPGLVQQVREFAAVLNAERRRRGEAEIAFTPQRPGSAGQDRRSRLLRDEGIGPGGGSEPSLRFVRGIERALGKRVVFFKPSAPVAWHAMTSPGRANTILVNVDADSPLAALIGHELGHNIKVQNPELYRRMRSIIYATGRIYSPDYDQAKRAQGYSPEKVEDEWISDVLGQRFDEPEFWQAVRREAEARGEQRAFAEFARESWEWLTGLLRRIRRLFTREADAGAVRQIEELRRGLAEVLVDYRAQMPAGGFPDSPLGGADTDLEDVQASTANDPRPGWSYRAGADTERVAGLNVVRQIYERRGQKPDLETADAIIDEMGVQQAAAVGLSADGKNGLDPVLREALLMRTMERATEQASQRTGAERAGLLRLVQRISGEHAPDLTVMGQAISMRQTFNRLDNPAGVIDQAVRDAQQAQDTAMGGKESAGKILKAVKDAVDEGTSVAVGEASKEIRAAARKVPVSKGVWQNYRDGAAAHLLRFVERATGPAPKASLQEFTDRVVSEMRALLAAQLPNPQRKVMPAAEVLREAIENREKYGDILTTVRSKFAQEHGEGSPVVELVDTELANLGLRPYSNRLLDRAIKEAHRALQTSAAELAKQHFTETDPQADVLADALVRSLGLTGPAAAELAASLSDRAKGIVSDARRKALATLAKKHTSTKVTRRVITAVMRAGLLNNIGALEVADLREAVAKDLKLPHITPEQAGKLAALSDNVRTAGNDMARGRAELKLLEEMRLYRGVRPVDLLTGIWYSNALSSPATHLANFGPGNLVGGLVQVGSMIATDPRRAPEAVTGFLQGLETGWADARSIIAKGEGLRDFGDKFGQVGRTLEIADARRDLPAWLPGKGLINFNVGMLRYVGRLMRAADTVFFHAAKDAYLNATTAKLLAAEYQGPELAKRVREVLKIAPDSWMKARARAQAEGWQGSDLTLRVANLIQQQRAGAIANAVGTQAPDMTTGAQLFAEQSTLNQEPEGVAGVVYQGLSHVAGGVRVKGVPVLKPFMMFLKIPTNLFNSSLNLTPLGAVRAWHGSMLAEVKRGAAESEETFTRRFMADDERARLYAQSAIGSLLMATVAAAALSGDDDQERAFDVTAKGPDDYRKRQQLEATGWRPYSLKFGDRWVSYKDSVMLIPLALVGAYVDATRYSGASDATLTRRLTNAAANAPRAIFETSMLQGLGELLDVLRGESSAARLESFLSRLAVTAQPYVPGTAMLSAIDRTLFPEQREADAPGGALTAAVPFVRNLGSERTDVLGEAVRRSPWDRFSSAETNDPLREVLRDKGVFISVPSRQTKLGNEEMDDNTYREYVRISGERIRQRLEPMAASLRLRDKEAVERVVDSITRQEREIAKGLLRARSRAVPAVINPFSVRR